MKRYFLFFAFIIIACSTKIDQRIVGIWSVQSKFYKGTFKIEKTGKKLVGKVLYYNDDTTILKETGTEKDIFLHDLKMKDDVFIDAVSGATTHTENLTIKIKSKDTLEVTTYIMKKPLVEIWTRNN